MDNVVKQKVTEIWHLTQKGETSNAKRKAVYLLREQPELVPAWLLLAELLETNEEKAQCYQRVLVIEANNKVALQFFEVVNHGIYNDIDKTPEIPELFEDGAFSTNQSSTFAQPTDEEMEDDDDDADPPDLSPEDTLGTYVVKELGSHADEDDIIREVCLRGQMDWYEAEEYINVIKDEQALTIAKRRSPLHLIIAIPTLIAGIVWFAFAVTFVIANVDNSISLNLIAIVVQVLRHFVGSIAMMLGGSAGIYSVLKSLGKIN